VTEPRSQCPRIKSLDAEAAVLSAVIDVLASPERLEEMARQWLARRGKDGADGAETVASLDRLVAEREKALADGMRAAIAAKVEPAVMKQVLADLQQELENWTRSGPTGTRWPRGTPRRAGPATRPRNWRRWPAAAGGNWSACPCRSRRASTA
jgi:hypothetical protein